MELEQFKLLNKVYDELIRRFVQHGDMCEPDKYEREDAFMGAILDIEDNGADMYETFRDSFINVHGIELTKIQFKSAYSLCKGFNYGK